MNAIYGRPDVTDEIPCTLLAHAIRVKRPNGTHVDMDLVALANITLQNERDMSDLRATVTQLSERIKTLEGENTRLHFVWQRLAGIYPQIDEDSE